ncbi:hypothetical protein [Nocardia xishanensis]|uniref:Uncharacterized protein n=1 Tax=Nocardia xishanensis TaxID=238964 RepID=A0ABW7X2N1_9NOCA
MFSKTKNLRRGAIRVAVAGAMVTIPLAAVAATASAETPSSGTVQVQQASQSLGLEGVDVSRAYPGGHHGSPGRPGRDKAESDESGYYTSPGAGPRVHQEGIPPTTSGG